ncbi:MAG: molybdenum cofactor guanylyltransferase [Candidatus Methanoperedenaceae archaeon]|nr:MAG: molybdenum cofactor guanylyltransferase [Candidatus Methanoperedenaceae archaeon]
MAYSGIILAGGKGKRMGYQEKALMAFNGKPLITYVIKSLEKVVDNIIISVRDKAQEELLVSVLPGYTYVSDAYENTGPLSGILSSLMVCRDEFCFIAACDMPFINENAVKLLFRKCEGHDAAIVRREDGYLEPLHAVYKCKPMVFETKKAIMNGKKKILAPIHKMIVNYVEIEEIRKIDPDLKTFININTLEDLNPS